MHVMIHNRRLQIMGSAGEPLTFRSLIYYSSRLNKFLQSLGKEALESRFSHV